jgi:hypothetical protein
MTCPSSSDETFWGFIEAYKKERYTTASKRQLQLALEMQNWTKALAVRPVGSIINALKFGTGLLHSLNRQSVNIGNGRRIQHEAWTWSLGTSAKRPSVDHRWFVGVVFRPRRFAYKMFFNFLFS